MKKEKKSKLNKKDKKQVVNTNTTSADKVTSDKKNQKNVNSVHILVNCALTEVSFPYIINVSQARTSICQLDKEAANSGCLNEFLVSENRKKERKL